ncbi:Small integral membrane protein 7-like [Caenorhabditis elegans]|uniref:Small integral membrane protein 7-like n=1 Tax=Caenorhabditis elegans TaxID=6239 RepID=E7EM27_CAEEL|nr:Small integral membrane protein 7-like [Caenorhabditis elegans]CCD68910.1 Small integral membrane protein 7-like [Caenorhabditis elegans]|eukprot:NP_001257275.1 Uncharacterized protein CELE_F01G12.18 [Caenorhabditis elegans]
MHFLHLQAALKDKLHKLLSQEEEHSQKTDVFDNIYSPFVLFGIFTCLGCVLGYVNYFRTERRRLHRFASQRHSNI